MNENNPAIIYTDFRIINWYKYENMPATPIDKRTMLVALNKTGKSVFLDALKYNLLGDTNFNEASETAHHRTIWSYTRGMTNKETGECMRPAKTHPNVYTILSCSMLNEQTGKKFVILTAIRTKPDNSIEKTNFVIWDAQNDDMESIIIQNDIPSSADDIRKKLKEKKLKYAEGMDQVYLAQGLPYTERLRNEYKKRINTLIGMRPRKFSNTNDFKNTLLPTKTVDVERLKARNKELENIIQEYNRIIAEEKCIDQILQKESARERIERRLEDDRILSYHIDAKDSLELIEDANEEIKKQEKIIEKNERLAEEGEKRVEELSKIYMDAFAGLAGLGVSKSIEETDRRLKEKKKDLDMYVKKIACNDALKKSVISISSEIKGISAVKGAWIFGNLSDTSIKAADKKEAFVSLKAFMQQKREDLNTDIHLLKNEKEKAIRERDAIQEQIASYEKNETNYDFIKEEKDVCERINKKLKEQGIRACASLAFENVYALTDVDWQAAIEMYLGKSRYTILVDPEYLDEANAAYDEIREEFKKKDRHIKAHMFNTKLLMKKQVQVEHDAASKFILTEDPVARKFYDYKLGRMHAVSKKDVTKYENAISKEGKVAASMDLFYMDLKRLRFYCLGQESIKQNKILAEQRSKELLEDIQELMSKITEKERTYKRIMAWMDAEGAENYDFTAYERKESIEKDLNELKKEKEKLIQAKENDREFITLNEKKEKAEKERQEVNESLKVYRDEIIKAKTEKQKCFIVRDSAKHKYDDANMKLQDAILSSHKRYEEIVKRFEAFIARGNKGEGGLLSDKTRSTYRSDIENVKTSRDIAIANYAHDFKSTSNVKVIPEVDIEQCLSNLRMRYRMIGQKDSPKAQREIKQKKLEFDDTFKNEFVLKICLSCEEAIQEIGRINKTLKTIDLDEEYVINAKMVKDGSEYETILDYAKYVREQKSLYGKEAALSTGQMMLDIGQTYSNEEVKEMEDKLQTIIEKVLDPENTTKLAEMSNYKNYITLSMKCHTPDKGWLDVEKHYMGMGSGAEIMTPCTIVLIASMLMLYNSKPQACARYLFFDEPFQKMDPVRIKSLMAFLRRQNFQAFFCAPDKLETIGEQCEMNLHIYENTEFNTIEVGPAKLYIAFSKLKQTELEA